MLCNQSALFLITELNRQIIDPQWAGSAPSDVHPHRSLAEWIRPDVVILDRSVLEKNQEGAMIKNTGPL